MHQVPSQGAPTMRIGFFDSGIGGLTILHAVRELLPEYDYLYYGDTKNLPYGDKAEAEIFTYTKNAIEYLFEHGSLLVVVACNTASAETLRILQDTLLVGQYADRRILGVIIPTIEVLCAVKPKHALLIGTVRTIESRKYNRELEKISSTIVLSTQATPELVPLIESNDMQGAWDVLKKVVESQTGEIDTIVLGCTHYTVLKDEIRKHFPHTVISQDEVIPEKLKKYLENHPEIESRLTRSKTLEVFLTGGANA